MSPFVPWSRTRRGAGAADHPHLALPPDPSNTLYVAADRLWVPGSDGSTAAAGVFDSFDGQRQLTAPSARTPSCWSLPALLMPKGRRALSYHEDPRRCGANGSTVVLQAASRGQEFVLDTSEYPDAVAWVASLFREVDPIV